MAEEAPKQWNARNCFRGNREEHGGTTHLDARLLVRGGAAKSHVRETAPGLSVAGPRKEEERSSMTMRAGVAVPWVGGVRYSLRHIYVEVTVVDVSSHEANTPN